MARNALGKTISSQDRRTYFPDCLDELLADGSIEETEGGINAGTSITLLRISHE